MEIGGLPTSSMAANPGFSVSPHSTGHYPFPTSFPSRFSPHLFEPSYLPSPRRPLVFPRSRFFQSLSSFFLCFSFCFSEAYTVSFYLLLPSSPPPLSSSSSPSPTVLVQPPPLLFVGPLSPIDAPFSLSSHCFFIVHQPQRSPALPAN